jgi:deoxyribonucleoside regulator
MRDAQDSLDLLARVAVMYYVEDKTQEEIAAAMGISRVKAHRLIKRAREENLVQVVVRQPIRRDDALQSALITRFGLRAAFVLRTDGVGKADVLPRVGQMGAQYLERTLRDGQTLAVCLGNATREVARQIHPGFQARVRVAQATGSHSSIFDDTDAATVVRELSAKLGGEVLQLAAPHTADNIEAASVIRRQRVIAHALDAARHADVALVGIGALDDAARMVRGGGISASEITRIRRAGGVGDMAGMIFDQAGRAHSSEYNRRVIGITLGDLKKIPLVLAVAAGAQKAAALQGALRSGAVDVIFTDDAAARGALVA